jgi:uncharacterized coiled-coil DUF342 family protein
MKVIAEFQGNMQDFKRYIDSLIATTDNMKPSDIENEMVNALQKILDLRLAMEELDNEVQSARKAYEKKLTEYRYAEGELEQLRNYLKALSQDYAKKVTA